MPAQTYPQNYRLGALYALTTAFLLAMQEPFSFLGARAARRRAVRPGHAGLAAAVDPAALTSSRRAGATSSPSSATPSMYPKLGRDLRARHDRARALQARPHRRASDHHRGDLQPVAVLGGDGGAADLAACRSRWRRRRSSAASRRRSSARWRWRGASFRRRRASGDMLGELPRGKLGVRDSDPDPVGAERHADRQMVLQLRRIGRDRRQFPGAGGGADPAHRAIRSPAAAA